MRKYIWIAVAALIASLVIFGVAMCLENKKIGREYEVAISNNKAYEAQLSEQKLAFQFTVDQLQYLNDSTIKELDSVRKQLKIKDNKIKQMSKIKEYVYVKDTLRIHDTIFKEPDFTMDTCLGDKWVENCLHMEYPNKISMETSVNTDQSVFLHMTRETINPPCKTWIGRLFQKKHDVYNVTVVENNPHATVKENKFIIIKE